jgi:3-hydroxy-9,10-secoandrosta-1,3,5(10)-triene-9,17-dione monooxygenase
LNDTARPLTADEARRAAAAIVPALKQRAQRCEDLRRCPDESIAEFNESGLMRVMQPRRFGGSELGIDAVVDIAIELCRGCPSTAWVWLNLATHAWNIGQFRIEAQHDVWDSDPYATAATGLAFPCGKAQKVDGGYRLSGRWPFASGIDAATWMLAGGMVEVGTGAPERRFFLVPKAHYRSLDNWRAYGLTGTGSHDVEIVDAFVPEHRTINAERFASGLETHGAQEYGTLVYRLPPYPTFGFALGVVPLGSAKAAVGEYVEVTRKRAGTYTGARLAELLPLQIRIGEASACVDYFEKTMRADMAEMIAMVERNESLSVEARLRWKRNVSFGTVLMKRAVDTLMAASGAGGLVSSGAMQRHFRDVNAAAAHIALTWDVQAAAYGQHALGMPLQSGLLI